METYTFEEQSCRVGFLRGIHDSEGTFKVSIDNIRSPTLDELNESNVRWQALRY